MTYVVQRGLSVCLFVYVWLFLLPMFVCSHGNQMQLSTSELQYNITIFRWHGTRTCSITWPCNIMAKALCILSFFFFFLIIHETNSKQLARAKVMMHVKIPKVERERDREGGRERETLANACVLLLWRRIIYWPIIWVKAFRGVAQILFCFFRFCLAEHKQCSCCKIKWLVSRDRLVPLFFFFFCFPQSLPKGSALDMIPRHFFSFFEDVLSFIFIYQSCMRSWR